MDHDFLSPVLGLQHIMGSTEFSSSHGAIHFHLLGYSNSPANEEIDEALTQWAFTAYHAYKEYEPHRPPDDLEALEAFDEPNQAAQMVALAVYDQCFADAQAMTTTHIAAVLQSHCGLSAMHPGIAPA